MQNFATSEKNYGYDPYKGFFEKKLNCFTKKIRFWIGFATLGTFAFTNYQINKITFLKLLSYMFYLSYSQIFESLKIHFKKKTKLLCLGS